MADASRTEQAVGAASRPMTSPANWALLGLLIGCEDYGYRLAQRLKRVYGATLVLGSESHVYTALDGLARRGLIEEVREAPDTRRQPRVRYRASAEGVGAYREWVAEQGARGSPLFARALSTLTGLPALALEILDGYERECLQRIRSPGPRANGRTPAGAAERIVTEDQRLAMEGRLPWIDLARSEFEKLLAVQSAAPLESAGEHRGEAR